jgi:hypothetical protein
VENCKEMNNNDENEKKNVGVRINSNRINEGLLYAALRGGFMKE